MKDSINKLKIYVCSLFGITALCSIVFIISMFESFDASTGYFYNSVLVYIQRILVVLSIAFFISLLFFIPKNTLPTKASKNKNEILFPSLFCGIIYAVATIMAFASVANNASKITETGKYVFLGIIISGLLSAVFFIIDAFLPDNSHASLKVFFSIFLIINLFLSIVYQHLDFFVGLNTPRKTLLFISFIASALFIVQELRFKIDQHQPRAYVIFGSCAVLLCSVMTIPGIFAHILGAVKDSSFLPFYLMGLALMIYISARIFIYAKNAE